MKLHPVRSEHHAPPLPPLKILSGRLVTSTWGEHEWTLPSGFISAACYIIKSWDHHLLLIFTPKISFPASHCLVTPCLYSSSCCQSLLSRSIEVSLSPSTKTSCLERCCIEPPKSKFSQHLCPYIHYLLYYLCARTWFSFRGTCIGGREHLLAWVCSCRFLLVCMTGWLRDVLHDMMVHCPCTHAPLGFERDSDKVSLKHFLRRFIYIYRPMAIVCLYWLPRSCPHTYHILNDQWLTR